LIHNNLLLILTLFFLMALLFLLSQRLKISYPIFLVIGGLAISFIPKIPSISISPDLIFLIFLPPLLFDAAWHVSWNQLWKWRRSILILGFGLVFATSAAVAYFSVAIIPGFTVALGFLLGGIISPPDAVAATSVLKGMAVPRRGLAILEGESLVNDAASLTIFRFALAAILTGSFVVKDALVSFSILSIMGVTVGLVIAHFLYLVLRYWARASSITTPITLIAPYLMYIVAESLEWSGVLAVVSGGLFLSFRSSDYLNYHTRMQTAEVWETVGFLLNGFVFILIGLELPVIINGLENYSMKEAIRYALLITLMVIVIRIILVYIASFVPRLLSKRIRETEKNPGFKLPFVIGWAGMRGVVSLASALAIPLTLSDGTDFPQRNLILFITFVVILSTLIFQGLSLPWIIKLLKVEEIDDYIPEEEQIAAIRLQLGKQSLEYLKNNYPYEVEHYDAVARIKDNLETVVATAAAGIQQGKDNEELKTMKGLTQKIMLELIDIRRQGLITMRLEKKYDDKVLRTLERNFDLEEARLLKP